MSYRSSFLVGYALYIFLPATLTFACLYGYLFGGESIRWFLAPWPRGLPESIQRELGFVENVQAAILIAAAFFALKSSRVEDALATQRWGWRVVACVIALILLEELDYGYSHLYALLGGPPWPQATFHMNPRNNRLIGLTADYFFLTLSWVAIPLSLFRGRQGWRRCLPNAALVFANPFYRRAFDSAFEYGIGRRPFLGMFAQKGPLQGALREFAELAAYSMLLVWVLDTHFGWTLPAKDSIPAGTAPAGTAVWRRIFWWRIPQSPRIMPD